MAEPWSLPFDASVEIHPAMPPEDLLKDRTSQRELPYPVTRRATAAPSGADSPLRTSEHCD
jgi:hypothetical protein